MLCTHKDKSPWQVEKHPTPAAAATHTVGGCIDERQKHESFCLWVIGLLQKTACVVNRFGEKKNCHHKMRRQAGKDLQKIFACIHFGFRVQTNVRALGCVCLCTYMCVCASSFVLKVSPISHSAMPCSLFWSMHPAWIGPPLSCTRFLSLTHLFKPCSTLTLH